MIVFGEVGSGRDIVAAGARYKPLTDQWLDLVSTRGPSPRLRHTAVWTGTGMLIYGGIGPDAGFDRTIYYYTRSKPLYLYKKP